MKKMTLIALLGALCFAATGNAQDAIFPKGQKGPLNFLPATPIRMVWYRPILSTPPWRAMCILKLGRGAIGIPTRRGNY